MSKTVKGVALMKRGGVGIDFIRSYGRGCDFRTEGEARIILSQWKEAGDQIVDCTITFTPPKGRANP